jgi:hypothetical protein
MTKQEKIREEWGELWETVKDYVDENGFVNCVKNKKIKLISFFHVSEIEFNGNLVRPKSLSGIENNIGWIKIESKDDLPKENGYFMCLYQDGEIIPHHFSINSEFDRELFLQEFTHYQPIVKPKPPIY